MRTVRFESSFSFRYSDRPGTRAARLPVKVPEDVAADRLLRLQALQDGFTSEALAHMVGRDIAVLVEGPSKKSAPNIHGRAAATGGATSWRGHDPYNHVVNVVCAASGDRTGTTVRAHVREAKKHSLLATER
jgi:tRNA-2-methylthio-N6-dimethylallyladenosine synthase